MVFLALISLRSMFKNCPSSAEVVMMFLKSINLLETIRCEIIDKSTVPTSKQLKYSDCLEDMDMLSEFFKTSHPAKYAICVGLDAKRMQMDWQDSKNKVDCGGVSHASHGDVCKPMGCPTGSMVFPKVTVLSCTSSDYIT
nr:zinc finger BED domain-containing protein RICESLEEPER 2-like [Ipomoea batatas]